LFDTTNPTWVQVRGLHDIQKLKEIWDRFGVPPTNSRRYFKHPSTTKN